MRRNMRHPCDTLVLIGLLFFLSMTCMPNISSADDGTQSVRVIAEVPVLDHIQAGLDWYERQAPLEVTAVPTRNLHPQVFASAFTAESDALFAHYRIFADLMQLDLFEPLKNIGNGWFEPPVFRQSGIILYQGEPVGVCFGGYNTRYLERPCLGIFATSPRKEQTARFLTALKEEEIVNITTQGELKRIAEAFFASLLHVEDHVSAFRYVYSDPARRSGEWTQAQFVDTMTYRWLYRRLGVHSVNVNLAEVTLVNDWVSPRDGLVYPLVAELYAEAVFYQDEERIWFGRYPVRYLQHWVPDGDEWKVLSAPYHLFE